MNDYYFYGAIGVVILLSIFLLIPKQKKKKETISAPQIIIPRQDGLKLQVNVINPKYVDVVEDALHELREVYFDDKEDFEIIKPAGSLLVLNFLGDKNNQSRLLEAIRSDALIKDWREDNVISTLKIK